MFHKLILELFLYWFQTRTCNLFSVWNSEIDIPVCKVLTLLLDIIKVLNNLGFKILTCLHSRFSCFACILGSIRNFSVSWLILRLAKVDINALTTSHARACTGISWPLIQPLSGTPKDHLKQILFCISPDPCSAYFNALSSRRLCCYMTTPWLSLCLVGQLHGFFAR